MSDIQYIIDENENKTHVILPFKTWEELQHSTINNDYMLITGGNIFHDDYLLQHYIDIKLLVNKTSMVDSPQKWLYIYKEFFKYYESLDHIDIHILYFLRKGILFNPATPEEVSEHICMLYMEYGLVKLINLEELTFDEYYELVGKSHTLNEIAFLQYFKANFSITFKKDLIGTRLTRKAERDRLFIYDLLSSTRLVEKTPELNEKLNKVVQESKKSTVKALANIFYKGNTSQVYRAKQEAQSKIDKV